jgi:hypothetical protein
MFTLPLIPQVLYWKWLAGSFIYYSYNDQGFNWLHPKIIEGLFHASNGWLAYSPIMIFSVIGLVLYKYIKDWATCLWIIFPVYIYIIYSWYCYTYINGLGSRPMIHLYPLLGISFAAVIAFILKKQLIMRVAFFTLSLFFIAVNISFSMQQSQKLLSSEGSNWVYNIQTLFHTRIDYNDLVCLDLSQRQPDLQRVTLVKRLACESYVDSLSDHFVSDPVTGNGYVYHMRDEENHPHSIVVKYNRELFNNAKWLRCSGDFMVPDPSGSYKHLLVISIKDKKGEFILWKSCRIENKIGADENTHLDVFYENGNEWGNVHYFMRIPSDIEEGDEITLDLWNIGKKEIYMDNICLDIYN